MGRSEVGFFRTFIALEFCDFMRTADDVEISGQPADLLAMDALGAGDLAKDLHQLRVVMCFHLIGQQVVAFDRIDFDLVCYRKQIVETCNSGTFAHNSKPFSKSAQSAAFPRTADWNGFRSPR